jgi:hypothetical protein
MERKRATFKSGFEELKEYIQSYKLTLTMSTAHKSVELFLAQSKRLYQDSVKLNHFDSYQEKELCRATKKMIEGCQITLVFNR